MTVPGNYEIIRSLGKGSFGEVFLARSGTPGGFQKQVAIKRLRDSVADDQELIDRFAIEARICSHLDHPNIIHVYNFIESPEGFLLVMEYLEGCDLKQLLMAFRKDRRVMPISLALHLALQLCDGLHFAHTAKGTDGQPLGLVHRDVKPSNLMLTHEGTLKIMDFGVARADFARTRSGMMSVKGTLQYMAPEQAAGGQIDSSVDQFATGLILAELLVGYPIYQAEAENQLYFLVGTGAVEPALEVIREHIPSLFPILKQALALDPAARFESLAALANALKQEALTLPPPPPLGPLVQALGRGERIGLTHGEKPAWPIQTGAKKRERERLRALARGLGAPDPGPMLEASESVELSPADFSLMESARSHKLIADDRDEGGPTEISRGHAPLVPVPVGVSPAVAVTLEGATVAPVALPSTPPADTHATPPRVPSTPSASPPALPAAAVDRTRQGWIAALAGLLVVVTGSVLLFRAPAEDQASRPEVHASGALQVAENKSETANVSREASTAPALESASGPEPTVRPAASAGAAGGAPDASAATPAKDAVAPLTAPRTPAQSESVPPKVSQPAAPVARRTPRSDLAPDASASRPDGASGLLRLRVQPANARVKRKDTGEILQCWNGCQLPSGRHTLLISLEDGRTYSWTLEMAKNADMKCLYRFESDVAPQCKTGSL